MEQSDRRAFLSGIGRLGAMAGVGALCGGQIACSGGGDTSPIPYIPPTQSLTWPLEYAPLDVEDVRKRGHESFYAGGCCFGTFDGIVRALRETVGAPFDLVPTDMMRYGAGGVAGFGSLCGTVNGASAAINLVTATGDAKAIISELMSWYAATALPTDKANEYAVNGEFYVTNLKSDLWLDANVSQGTLCHESVTGWCRATGYASGSNERKERCARITGDVAARAAELMNQLHAGTFQAVSPIPSSLSSCAACHKEGEDYDAGQFTNGKMNCNLCHVDPSLDPHN